MCSFRTCGIFNYKTRKENARGHKIAILIVNTLHPLRKPCTLRSKEIIVF
ncbi:MAG: hypothetical protein LBC54_00585 [Bacteroidales bacterium OttesenSCG-928-I14]|nr:hypothetical protein [Bacteroidales bacterium OttesenSCG-928-I14]